LGERLGHALVSSEREDSARGGDRAANKYRDHVKDHDELDESTNPHARETSRGLRSRQREEGRASVLTQRAQIEVESRNLRERSDDVKAPDDQHRRQHGARNVLFGTIRLFGQIGRRLKTGEEQDAVEDAEK